MRRASLSALLGFAVLPPVFAACAGSGEESSGPRDGGGAPETGMPDSSDAAPDVRDVDAEAIRCSHDFCIVDLPNPQAYGFSEWVFAGVQADPAIGAWAIANGVHGVDKSSAQLLRFENGAWKAIHSPALGSGAGQRAIELFSLASDGAGHLIAVGATLDDGTAVIVRGDGTTFTTSSFDGTLSAVWFAEVGQAWAAGAGGSIYRSLPDGGWESEGIDVNVNFESVWGSGPNDLYVGGINMTEDPYAPYGYLGHRTVDDAGAVDWTFQLFEVLQQDRYGESIILAGVSPPGGGPRFWAAPNVIARTASDDRHDEWVADAFSPRAVVRAFWAHAKNDIWAVGHVGRVFHFDGTSWNDALLTFNGAPLTTHLRAITGTSAGEIFVVGEGAALWRKAK